jgi:hypothetical protein
MRVAFTFICCVIPVLVSLAQQTIRISGDGINVSNSLAPIRQADGMAGFDIYRKQLLGSPYEDSTFQAGNIRFYKRPAGTTIDSLMGVLMRYDLQAHQLEILAGPNNIRVAYAAQVRQFAVNNKALNTVTYYLNTREFKGEAEQLQGFFDVIAAGRAMLLRYPSVSISKANYNMSLNVGSKDDELVTKQDWYAALDKKVVAFSPSKRGILALFADKESEMADFLKRKKPDLKSRSGLASVFEYYNSL